MAAPAETRNTQLAASKKLIHDCGWKGGDRGKLGKGRILSMKQSHKKQLQNQKVVDRDGPSHGRRYAFPADKDHELAIPY